MNTAITFNSIITVFGLIVAFVAGLEAVKKIIKFINEEHDRMEKYDAYEGKINEVNDKVDRAHEYATQALKEIKDETTEAFRMMQDDTDAKLQEIKAEQCLLTYAMLATLDGLKQLNCNGKVSEARELLDKHLNKQAHGVD